VLYTKQAKENVLRCACIMYIYYTQCIINNNNNTSGREKEEATQLARMMKDDDYDCAYTYDAR